MFNQEDVFFERSSIPNARLQEESIVYLYKMKVLYTNMYIYHRLSIVYVYKINVPIVYVYKINTVTVYAITQVYNPKNCIWGSVYTYTKLKYFVRIPEGN